MKARREAASLVLAHAEAAEHLAATAEELLELKDGEGAALAEEDPRESDIDRPLDAETKRRAAVLANTAGCVAHHP